eukprot:15448798-Alexandrium_andersonii.AAC.1
MVLQSLVKDLLHADEHGLFKPRQQGRHCLNQIGFVGTLSVCGAMPLVFCEVWQRALGMALSS